MARFTLSALLAAASMASSAIADSVLIQLENVESINAVAGALMAEPALDTLNVRDQVQIGSFKALFADIDAQQLSLLKSMNGVADVVHDQIFTIQAPIRGERDVERNPFSWGLDRIDQESLPLDQSFSFPAHGGQGVDVFVIDTGIRPTHKEFQGTARVVDGASFVKSEADYVDGNGHGTHVAGTIAGTTTGIARKVNLYAVKVLSKSGSGNLEGIVKGLEYAVNTAKKNKRPAVANMSLGSYFNSAINNAVASAISEGLTVVVASGNSNMDACSFSPASVETAITVNALAADDTITSFSNYGKCTHITAPGDKIDSAFADSDSSYKSLRGTSMAAPHVCGVAALVLAENPTFTPLQVREELLRRATKGAIKGLEDEKDQTPNNLLKI